MNLSEFVYKREGICISPTAMSTQALMHLYRNREYDPYFVKILQDKHCMNLEIDICRKGKYMHEDYPTKTIVMEYDNESPNAFTHKYPLDTFAVHYIVSIYGRNLQTGERTCIKTYDMMRMTENKRNRTIYEILPNDYDTEISHTDNILKWIPSEKEVELLFGQKSVWDMFFHNSPKILDADDITNALYVPYMPYVIIMSITSLIMMSMIIHVILSFFY
jgi:hypothetical protein